MRGQIMAVCLMLIFATAPAFAEEARKPAGLVLASGNDAQGPLQAKAVNAPVSEAPKNLEFQSPLYDDYIVSATSKTEGAQLRLRNVGMVQMEPGSILSISEKRSQGTEQQAANQEGTTKTILGVLQGTTSLSTQGQAVNVELKVANSVIGVRGTEVSVTLQGDPHNNPQVLGFVKTHDSGKASVVDVTPEGGKTVSVDSTKGKLGVVFFRVKNGVVDDKLSVQQEIENQIRQAGIDRSTQLGYLNSWSDIQKYYDLIYSRGGTEADFLVSATGLADTIKAPETQAKKVFIASPGEYRLDPYYPSQEDLYKSYIDGTNVNVSNQRDLSLPSPLFPFVNKTYAYEDPVVRNLSSRGFAMTGLMADTPSELVPFLTNHVFLADSPEDPGASYLFLNSFKVPVTDVSVNGDGVEIDYGNWSVSLDNFSNQVILAPVTSSQGFSESYLTASPVFYWITSPDLLGTKPISATYFFDQNHFQATDSLYRSKQGSLPTVEGYLNFNFSGNDSPTLGGTMKVTVPYDHFLTVPVTPGRQTWNVVDFKGSSFDVTPDGTYSISNLIKAVTKHYNPFTNIASSFDGHIVGKVGGNNGQVLTGAFNFVEPPIGSDLKAQPINGLAGTFIAHDSLILPGGDYLSQLQNTKNNLGPVDGRSALMPFGNNGEIEYADQVFDSPNTDLIKGDKVFVNSANNTMIFNPKALNTTTAFDIPANDDFAPIQYGLWNSNENSQPAVLNSVEKVNFKHTPGLTQQVASQMPWVAATPVSWASAPTMATFDFSNAAILGLDAMGNSVSTASGTLNFDFTSHSAPTVSASGVTFGVVNGDQWAQTGSGASQSLSQASATQSPVLSVPISGIYTSAASGNTPNFQGNVGVMLTAPDPNFGGPNNAAGAFNLAVDKSVNFDASKDAASLNGIFFGPTTP